MYRLFLSATLRVALVTVLMLATVLGTATSYFVYQIYQRQADTLASRVLAAIAYRQTSSLEVTPEYLESLATTKDDVTVILPDGSTVSNLSGISGPVFTSTRVSPSGEWTVIAAISQGPAYLMIGLVAMVTILVSAISLAVAYRVADRESRRVNRPLNDLAAHAETIGSGQPTRKAKPVGIDEIDRIARVLDDRAGRVGEVLEAERRTSREMSHQVRTPLTALSLRLEEIILTDDLAEAKAEAAVGVVQIERLTEVIDQLVKGRREGVRTEQEELDLSRLVGEQMVEWYPVFANRRRRITLQANGTVVAWASKAGQSQVLATLIENCLIHGRGDVLIRLRESGSSAVIEVVDTKGVLRLREGVDPFERGVSASGTGLGLALARTLVAADDGDIALTSRKPVTFTVYLPRFQRQDEEREAEVAAMAESESIGPA
ncbi:MAG: HAMP domain-containing histidine kinase [Actinobacteria bacterium]|nr:HAMP domain-containing histidine kinase [Actinomycetota bacterium]